MLPFIHFNPIVAVIVSGVSTVMLFISFVCLAGFPEAFHKDHMCSGWFYGSYGDRICAKLSGTTVEYPAGNGIRVTTTWGPGIAL